MSDSGSPTIRKAGRLTGKTLTFRDASVVDAEFILSLRMDSKKSKFLSKTSADIDAQRDWLDRYTSGIGQAYFVIESEATPIGTVRLYDAQGASFCWGSWILHDSRPRQAAMESMLMVYSYAVDHLGFLGSHFDVRKGNEKVLRFHERIGAIRVGETTEDILYRMGLPEIRAVRSELAHYLPNDVIVEGLQEDRATRVGR